MAERLEHSAIECPYSASQIVDLILAGHWSISAVTNNTIWRIYRAFGSEGRRRMNDLPPLDEFAPPEAVRDFEHALLTLEVDLLHTQERDKEEERRRAGQLEFPWTNATR